MRNSIPGSPLTQVLVHASYNNPEIIDIEILEKLTTNTTLDIKIYCMYGRMYHYTPIILAMKCRRIDIVKILVEKGANPISPHLKFEGVIGMLAEYYYFGTNNYLSWLLHEHLLPRGVSNFTETVFAHKDKIFNEIAKRMFQKIGRHHAHAILTCGHDELIKCFVNDDSTLLICEDTGGRTALQISAEQGNLESIQILLSL